MGEFNAAHALHEVRERQHQLTAGEKLVPVLTAIIAVLAALATLFAHHSSTRALAQKNEGVLLQTKAADQYNYYESKRIRVQLNQTFIDSGLVRPNTAGRKRMDAQIASESADADAVLAKARSLEAQAADIGDRSERFMTSYDNFQVSATIFEIGVVLLSVSALAQARPFLIVAIGAAMGGLAFMVVGFLT